MTEYLPHDRFNKFYEVSTNSKINGIAFPYNLKPTESTMSTEEKIIKRYYSISEVAKELNVNASLIRFWEKEFDQIKPKKNKKGNRLFTIEDLDNLRIVYHLVKEKGFTLEGARKRLKEDKKELKATSAISKKLARIKAELLQIKNTL